MAGPSERIVRIAGKSLKRVLGVSDLFSVGYGDVGSSIYYALGATALFALGATPLALACAGLAFICTALTYAEMAAAYPEPGGVATFSRHAFNDLIAFIAGWGLLLDYIVTLAISAFTIPPYLAHLFSFLHIPFVPSGLHHTLFTIALIALLFAINFIGVKYSGRFSFILAVFTFITQAGIIAVGVFCCLNLPFLVSHLRIGLPQDPWSPSLWGFLKGTAAAMVAYTGIEAITQLAAEVKKPGLTIPRAIKLTIVVVLFCYIGLSSVGLSVISPQELGTRYLEDPVAGIVSQFPFGGKLFTPWVGLIAAVILLIAANAGLIGCSRLTFSMGERYLLPSFFFKLHSRFRTPYISLAVFSILGAIVVIISRNQMLFLVDLYNFGAQLAFFSVHLALIILRIRKPNLHRPFRAPLNIPIGKGRSIPLTAIVGVIVTFSVWLLVVITKPVGRVAGVLWIGLGIFMFLAYRKKKKIAVTGTLAIETIKIPEYRPMHLKHVLVAARAGGGTEMFETAFQLARAHHAKVTGVYVIEVPYTIPFNAYLEKKEKEAELALKRLEAVAREHQISVELQSVRSRSYAETLLQICLKKRCDLIVLGIEAEEFAPGHHSHFASEAEWLLKNAPCRVLFCKT